VIEFADALLALDPAGRPRFFAFFLPGGRPLRPFFATFFFAVRFFFLPGDFLVFVAAMKNSPQLKDDE
jgi:hypothetical protein